MSERAKIAILGSATIDKIIKDLKISQKIGGTVIYGGITFQKHGLPTVLVTNIAQKDGRILKTLDQLGLEVISFPSEETTSFVNHYKGEMRWQEMHTKAAPITLEQALPVIRKVDHVHLGSLHPEDLVPELFEELAHNSCLVSLDVQGYVREIKQGQVQLKISDILHKVLQAARVIKADHSELEAILKSYRMDRETLKKVYGLEELVITRADMGGTVVAGETVRYPAEFVPQVMDSTGAGDVFFAAYLAKRYHEDESIAESSRHAASIAAAHVAGRYLPVDALDLSPAPWRYVPITPKHPGKNLPMEPVYNSGWKSPNGMMKPGQRS